MAKKASTDRKLSTNEQYGLDEGACLSGQPMHDLILTTVDGRELVLSVPVYIETIDDLYRVTREHSHKQEAIHESSI